MTCRTAAAASGLLLVVASMIGGARPATAQPDEAEPPGEDAGVEEAPADTPGPATEPAEPALPEPAEPPTEGPAGPPPERWDEWELAGELIDPPDVVRAFVNQRMATAARVLTQSAIDELAEFCRTIGYELIEVRTTRSAAGRTQATVELRPLLTVFWVDVEVDNFVGGVDNFLPQFFERLPSDDVQRRMQLRQGDAIPRDPRAQRSLLLEESRHIEEYVRNEGFFDVRARVWAEPHGKHSVTVKVKVNKGRRYRVGKVTVTGNAAVPAYEIIPKFHRAAVCLIFCVGTGRFRRDDLNEDIQKVVKLYQERGYPGVRVTHDFDARRSFRRRTHTVDFTVKISERRKIDVVFEGNNKEATPDERLEQVLTFNDEGSYDDVEVENSAEAIRAFYQNQGKFEAQVTWERERFGGVFERIIFTIDEGRRLPVVSVRFEGNQALSDGYLSGLVKTRVYRRIAVLGGGGGYATRAQLEQDIAEIRSRYRNRGYYQAEVTAEVTRNQRAQGNAAALAAAVAASLPASGLYVVFHVTEGKQQKVAEVRFEFEVPTGAIDPGDTYFERRRAQLAAAVTLKADSPYTEGAVKQDNQRIGRFYYRQGHPYADTETEVIEDGSPERLIIEHRITEGPPVRFGHVIVRGNHHTDDWVVLDELDFDKGDSLTLDRANRAQQNLRSSGLFRTVNVRLIDLELKRADMVNVVVEVQERERYGYELAAGASTEVGSFGPFTEGAIFHHNLLGAGIRGNVHALVAWPRQQYVPVDVRVDGRLGFPRWIGRRMTFGAIALTSELGTFFRQEDTERFGVLRTAGANLTLSKRWAEGRLEGVSLGLRYDVRQSSRDEELVRPAGQSEDLETAKVATTTGSIGPVLTIDKRRDSAGRLNPLAPQSGWYGQLSASYADSFLSVPIEILPGVERGRDRFVKFGAIGQTMWKPNRRTLITIGARYDHGVPLGDEFLLPEVERFFAGGDTTMRGFEKDQLATEIIEEPVPPLGGITRIRVLPAGGNIRALSTIDFQLDVAYLSDFPLASAIFLDNGIITNSWVGVEARDVRHSLGLALARLVTPFGSFSLEYAIPLDPKRGDNPRGRFHFNIGLQY